MHTKKNCISQYSNVHSLSFVSFPLKDKWRLSLQQLLCREVSLAEELQTFRPAGFLSVVYPPLPSRSHPLSSPSKLWAEALKSHFAEQSVLWDESRKAHPVNRPLGHQP